MITTSRKGTETDKWYSGKAHEHAGLVQGIISPDGVPLWASGVRLGSTHDITAARELVLPGLRPWLKVSFPASPIPGTRAPAPECSSR